LNAAPMPGIRLFTREPFFLKGDHGIGVKASLEEYLMDDERYIEDTRVHHKSIHAVYRSENNFQIDIGVQHFVQWAGNSEEFGELPGTFDDYLRIISGMASEGDVGNGQEVNALGNQIGSYELKVKTKIRDLDFRFLYNHIFEDASGMKGGNLPDGRYAVYFEDNRDAFWGSSWLKAFMYEFYYTKNQSRDRAGSLVDGADNYFNNNLYRSGWTYNKQIIGVPFILLNDNNFRIGTNIVMAHHLGIRGQILENYPYRFLLSYRKNYGVKDSFFPETKNILSTLFELELLNTDYVLKAQVGADIKSNDRSNIGVGINFSKILF
ncbi:MAG: capsule assembly Wzi family protein, partial [Gramella sp.]|nr:capsule assembly Wzi family protein [Christiangramia sp.]